jgi:hypothetical protein
MKKVTSFFILVIIIGFETETIPISKKEFDANLFHYFFKDIYKEVLTLDPALIKLIYTCKFLDFKDFNIYYLNEPLTLLKEFLPDKIQEAFTYENITEKVGNIKFDYTIQNEPEEVVVLSDKKPINIKISSFINKMKKGIFKEIAFGQNIDMSDKIKEFKNLNSILYDNLPSQFKYMDWLRELPCTIPGVNEPQIYLKTPSVWTGCHEENACLRSINNCHGPGASLWLGVKEEITENMNKALMDKFKIDFYVDDHLFFPTIEFCLRHGIEVICGVQSEKDTILVAPGTRHW